MGNVLKFPTKNVTLQRNLSMANQLLAKMDEGSREVMQAPIMEAARRQLSYHSPSALMRKAMEIQLETAPDYTSPELA